MVIYLRSDSSDLILIFNFVLHAQKEIHAQNNDKTKGRFLSENGDSWKTPKIFHWDQDMSGKLLLKNFDHEFDNHTKEEKCTKVMFRGECSVSLVGPKT